MDTVARSASGAQAELVGGWLALDVANSVDFRERAEPDDHLRSYDDLVALLVRAGALDEDRAATLLAAAATDAAADELERAKRVREAAFRVFHACAAGVTAAPADLDEVQASYGESFAAGRLDPGPTRFSWSWPRDDLRVPRWLVARSAVELLLSGDRLARLKACASQLGCRYLFLDTSKNGSRRWCSMATCGATAKSLRLTARRREQR